MRALLILLFVGLLGPLQANKRTSGSSRGSSGSSSSGRSSLGSVFSRSSGSSSSGSSASSYPKQQWGSGSGVGSGASSVNKPASSGTAGGYGGAGGFGGSPGGGGGFGNSAGAAGAGAALGGAGGFAAGSAAKPGNVGGGGFASPSGGGFAAPGNQGSIGGGGFYNPGTQGRPGSVGAGGFNTHNQGNIGGGGFVNPGSQGSIGGGGFVNPSQGKPGGLGTAGTALGAGGLGAAGGYAAGSLGKPAVGSGGFQGSSNNFGTGGSNFGTGGSNFGTGGSHSFGSGGVGSHGVAGAAGALGGFGAAKATNHYSYPKSTGFSSLFHKKPKTFSSPGYGTAWGTKFGPNNVYKEKKGFSKKALGLGVAAGFVGGAALGVAGTMATYSVYHRYQEFKNMMSMRGFPGYGLNNDFDSSYRRNECMFGCGMSSHCEWGFCECDYGYERRFGQCGRVGSVFNPRPAKFDPFVACSTAATCQSIDINMVCNTELTVQAGGKCQCKQDMKWNEATGECQMFLDVDCSSITYDTPPSKIILDAVRKAEANNISSQVPQESERTPTIEESINSSLLSQLDRNAATAAEIKEAYCRDIDSFSFDFNIDDDKPPACDPVPRTACGVVHDSHDCTGGWKLIISEGQISFPFFSSYWKYRNDVDLIGVKAGCTLTAFSDTEYTGNQGTFRTDAHDQWWRLSEYAEFQHLDQDIESIQCVCRKI